ncbi:MAG: hypothetical protein ACLQNG_09980 [Acidimicrobiales bacterium]|jgi:hypothetical protein
MSDPRTGRSDDRRRRSRRTIGVAAVAVGTLAGALLAAGPAVAAAKSTGAGGAKHAHSYGFRSPDAAAVAGGDLFVANRAGNSLTELNASSGVYVRTIFGTRYDFSEPTALQVIGPDLFVANWRAGVTEVTTSNGALVRTLRGSGYGFSYPRALAADDGYLYVLSAKGAVTKISASSGKPSGIASGSQYGFDRPTAIVAVGTELFVTNSGSDSVTEINAGTMKQPHVLQGGQYGFDEPTGIAAHGGGVWVTNYAGPSLTEISASTGKVDKVIGNYEGNLPSPAPITFGDGFFFAASPPGASPMITQIKPTANVPMPWMMCNTNGPYKFSNPEALVVANATLWVVNEGSAGLPGDSLTEMNAVTGALIRTID